MSGSSSPGTSTGTGALSDARRRNAIIGVCVTFGAVGLLVLTWWIARVIRRKRETRHRPLIGGGPDGTVDYFASYGATTPSMEQAAPSSNLGVHGMEERRRSFFFAEDELRGYDDGNRQEETTYVSRQPSGRRGPIKPGAISAPILRESSLNW
jgi:hypothetical protein